MLIAQIHAVYATVFTAANALTGLRPLPKMRTSSLILLRQNSRWINELAQVSGAIAQLGERNTGSVEVSGSIPLSSTNQKAGTRKSAGFFVCTASAVSITADTSIRLL